MKVCVFGGTFDPLHLGHESIINKLLLKFDKVIIMPSKQSPGKNNFPLANDLNRMDMLLLCDFSKGSNCIISDYELKSNKNPSYTIETIKYIKNEFSNSEIYLAVGLDQLNDIKNWYQSDVLLAMIKIICFNRNSPFNNKLLVDYEFIEDFNYNISSSEIRNFILNDNKRVKDMLNKEILDYIIKEKLYK